MYTSQDLLTLMEKLHSHKFGVLASGNCSVRIDANSFAIKPTGMDYGEIAIDDICIISNGIVDINNKRKVSSDFIQHQIIYNNNPQVNCIIHTHSHFATVLAIMGIDIPVFCTMHADGFGRPIKCFPFVNHRNANFGDDILYSEGIAFLLGGHGTISLGVSVDECYKSAVILEESAKLFYHSKLLGNQLGKDVSEISDSDIATRNTYYQSSYGQ